MSHEEPEFGDVFEYPGRSGGPVMLVRPGPTRDEPWFGISLRHGDDWDPPVQRWRPVSDMDVKFVGNVGVEVEMTCDHAHRGAITTQIHADLVWRGCTYQRLDAKGYASGGFISPATGYSYKELIEMSSSEVRAMLARTGLPVKIKMDHGA